MRINKERVEPKCFIYRFVAKLARSTKYLRGSMVFKTLSTVFCLALQNPPLALTQPAATASTRSTRWSPSTSNGARFISPKEGQIVHPGETISINFELDPKIKVGKGIAIISSMGDLQFREASPYSFTFTVPDKDLRRVSNSLIGFQELALFGDIAGRENNNDDLATTTVDVEEPDLPVSLDVVGPMQPIPNRLNLLGLGKGSRIEIDAKFPDGHEFDVTDSTYLSLSSENSAIAFVADNETIVSVGAGQTHIIITYTIGHHQKQISVPVTVQTSSLGIDISPAFFNFGDVPSNTVSNPLQIIITNHTQEKVHISKLEPVGGFSVGPENCSDTILSKSGSCTITVRFAPISAGPVYSTIFVSNDETWGESIFLFGKGT